jgi:hypothetical protein
MPVFPGCQSPHCYTGIPELVVRLARRVALGTSSSLIARPAVKGEVILTRQSCKTVCVCQKQKFNVETAQILADDFGARCGICEFPQGAVDKIQHVFRAQSDEDQSEYYHKFDPNLEHRQEAKNSQLNCQHT